MATLIVPRFDPDSPWPTLGPQVCDLLEQRSIFGPGSLQGEPAELDDDKRAAIYSMYEVYPQGHQWAGRRRYKRCGISVRKGLAKALALDTQLPTPEGWVSVADVSPGDTLFDEDGRQTRVLAVSEVFEDHDCYRVSFKDGTSIVADAGHRWYTEELRHRYAGSVKTTEDLARTVTHRTDKARNHRIPVAKPLDTPPVDLPIDPWVLGAWLGDGRTNDSEFTMHGDDHPHFVEQIEAAGYFHAVPKPDSRRPSTWAVRASSCPIKRGNRVADTLIARLRTLGVLGNKHIPAAYLRASLAQRLRLLQGLMDTDGSITADGSAATFINTVECLARGVFELLCSVGLKPTIKPFVTAAGTSAWKVYVYADSATPIFSLPRKAARQRAACTSRTAMSTNRHIVAVERVATVPTKCIAVDSPSHLFLAGESMVPTHNTELMAWITLAELHPDGPVRCDGFDAHGQPVGRPVKAPYIPLLAVTVEQVEELAYGALYYMVTEGPDADLFDATLERIVRLSPMGRADGKAVPLSNSPGSRDGARTTFQGFDEPHRLYLPRQRKAHETMLGNMSKRVLEDPWSLYVGTAGEPGENSIAEDIHHEAQAIDKGEITEPRLWYFCRWAEGRHNDLTTKEDRIEAVSEATGPVGEYGPGQFDDIASQWDRKGADKQYLERVWLNRWVRSNEQAFDPVRRKELRVEGQLEAGAFVTLGFDGARRRDSTAIVLTEIATGKQQLWAVWEKDPDDPNWEVPQEEVDQVIDEIDQTFEVWRGNFDPPYWVEDVARWAGKYEWVEEWWSNFIKRMAYAVRAYREALDDGAVTFACEYDATGEVDELEDIFYEHCAAAGKNPTNFWDDQEPPQRLFILGKLHPDRKFDVQMAAILSWMAYLQAIKEGAEPTPRVSTRVQRLR